MNKILQNFQKLRELNFFNVHRPNVSLRLSRNEFFIFLHAFMFRLLLFFSVASLCGNTRIACGVYRVIHVALQDIWRNSTSFGISKKSSSNDHREDGEDREKVIEVLREYLIPYVNIFNYAFTCNTTIDSQLIRLQQSVMSSSHPSDTTI